jgi:hypothetical protein
MAESRSRSARTGGPFFASVAKVGGGRIYPRKGKALRIPPKRWKEYLARKAARKAVQLPLPFPPPRNVPRSPAPKRPRRPAGRR